MRAMILVKASKESEAGVMPGTDLLEAMGRFNEELSEAGILLAGEGLHPSSKGIRVIFKGGGQKVETGPFPPTNDLLAGFWLWQIKDMDEAVAWVRRIPQAKGMEQDVEIRRVFEAEDFGEAMTPSLREQEDRLRVQSEDRSRKPPSNPRIDHADRP